jgi:hypothetical protein
LRRYREDDRWAAPDSLSKGINAEALAMVPVMPHADVSLQLRGSSKTGGRRDYPRSPLLRELRAAVRRDSWRSRDAERRAFAFTTISSGATVLG